MSTLAGESVRVHLIIFRAVGILRAPHGISPLMTSLHQGYRRILLAALGCHVMQQLVFTYQVRNNLDKLVHVLYLMLCLVTSLTKQIVFHIDARRIDQVLQILDDSLFNPTDSSSRSLLRSTSKNAQRLVTVYVGTAVVTCILWMIFPILDYARGQLVEIQLRTHFDCSSTPMFILVLLYTNMITTLSGISNTTMDAFMATILYQNKTQLGILRNNLSNLSEAADEESTRTGESRETVLLRMFHNCLAHYGKVVESITLFQDIFGIAIFIQFTTSGWILCMSAYKIVSLNIFSIEFASMVLYTLCILTELFLYCYYGNEVCEESDRLIESLYLVRWDDAGIRFQRALILAMERAKRSLRPTAGGIVPLSLDTFIQILKSSYTFYTVLRQTK